MMRQQNVFYIARLMVKYLRNELSGEEARIFDSWLAEKEENRQLLESFRETSVVQEEVDFIGGLDIGEAWQLAMRRRHELGVKRKIIRFVGYAAAVILLVLSYVWLKPTEHDKGAIPDISYEHQNDVLPGGNKAYLILSDGKQFDLMADVKNLKEKDGTMIVGDNGELSYVNSVSEDEESLIYNTLVVPKTGTYKLILPDGTKVWLNAASSLKYPVSFSNKKRIVELKGEAYFEVKKDPHKPFSVKVNGTTVDVLGTNFNINSYASITTTTLVKGSVRVANKGGQQLLKPGQQAQMGKQITVLEADTTAVTAWKNGDFYFKNNNIVEIMDQLSRWYDLDIVYKGKIVYKNENSGSIKRDINLSEVLEMLTYLSGASFEVDGRKVTVKFKNDSIN